MNRRHLALILAAVLTIGTFGEATTVANAAEQIGITADAEVEESDLAKDADEKASQIEKKTNAEEDSETEDTEEEADGEESDKKSDEEADAKEDKSEGKDEVNKELPITTATASEWELLLREITEKGTTLTVDDCDYLAIAKEEECFSAYVAAKEDGEDLYLIYTSGTQGSENDGTKIVLTDVRFMAVLTEDGAKITTSYKAVLGETELELLAETETENLGMIPDEEGLIPAPEYTEAAGFEELAAQEKDTVYELAQKITAAALSAWNEILTEGRTLSDLGITKWEPEKDEDGAVLSATVVAENAGIGMEITEDESDSETEELLGGSIESEGAVPVSEIKLNVSTWSLFEGETYQLVASILPGAAAGTPITWTSNNTSVATVNSDGLLSAVSEGTATIDVSAGGKMTSISVLVYASEVVPGDVKGPDQKGDIWIAGFEDSFVFTGEPIEQTNLRVYHRKKLLVEGEDYTISYKNNLHAAAKDASNAPTMLIKMKGAYSGVKSYTFEITARDINEASLGEEGRVQNWNGKVKQFAQKILYNGNLLVSGKDYSVSYSMSDRTGASGYSYEYNYTVTGCGDYCGAFSGQFIVASPDKNLTNAKVTVENSVFEYDGNPITLDELGIIRIANLDNNVQDPIVRNPGGVLTAQQEWFANFFEFAITMPNAENGPGTAILTITPSVAGENNNYRGKIEVKIRITGYDISKQLKIGDDISAVTYRKDRIGSSGGIEPTIVPQLTYLDGTIASLVEGDDYIVSYRNNTKPGRATMIVNGIGEYRGTIKKTFTISPGEITSATAPVSVDYVPNGVIPEVNVYDAGGSLLEEKKDYTIRFTKNGRVGTAGFEVTGKGCYQGSYQGTFDITTGNLANCSVVASDQAYSVIPTLCKATPSVIAPNGIRLIAGKDYKRTVTYSYDGMVGDNFSPAAGTTVTITVEATDNGNFTGSVSGTYRIFAKEYDIKALFITVDDQVYNNACHQLSLGDPATGTGDIHVYLTAADQKAKTNEVRACDYVEIVSQDEGLVGNSKVTLRGVGNYAGMKSIGYKIRKKVFATIHVSGVALNQSAITMGPEEVEDLVATILPDDADNQTVTWSSSNSSILQIVHDPLDNKHIKVKGVGKGTAKIRATAQDNGKYAECTVTVRVTPVSSVTFTLAEKTINMSVGQTKQLEYTYAPSTASVLATWTTSNPDYYPTVTVTDTGLVTAVRQGVTYVMVELNKGVSGGTNGKVIDLCKVVVTGAPGNVIDVTADSYWDHGKEYWATPNDNTNDDQVALQLALNSAQPGDVVYVPAGEYQLNTNTKTTSPFKHGAGIVFWEMNNVTLLLDPGAVLKGNENMYASEGFTTGCNNPRVIQMVKSKGCSVTCGTIVAGKVVRSTGAVIDGNRSAHIGSAGEQGNGIWITECWGTTISNITIQNCWGDGINMGEYYGVVAGNENQYTTISNVKMTNNRRNAMSITYAKNVVVEGSQMLNSNGIDPQFGVCLETNNNSIPVRDTIFWNCKMQGNNKTAFGIMRPATNITLGNCTIVKGPHADAYSIYNAAGSNITIMNGTTLSGEYYGLGGAVFK